MPIDINPERGDALIAFVKDYWEVEGAGPSYRDIAKGIGLSSASSVKYWIVKLSDEKRIAYVPGQARSVHLPFAKG